LACSTPEFLPSKPHPRSFSESKLHSGRNFLAAFFWRNNFNRDKAIVPQWFYPFRRKISRLASQLQKGTSSGGVFICLGATR
jgi:hypothetical protein